MHTFDPTLRCCCSAPRNWRRSAPSTPSPIGQHLRSAFADGACRRRVAWRKAWNSLRKPWPTSAPLGLSRVFHSFSPCLRALLGTQVGQQKGSNSLTRRCGKSRQRRSAGASPTCIAFAANCSSLLVMLLSPKRAFIKQSELHVGRAQNYSNCAPLPV